DENQIGTWSRVFEFATALWQADARVRLRDVLAKFSQAGHLNGLLTTSKLRLRLTSPEDPVWRCSRCARIHLHLGASICTRCFSSLPGTPNGVARDVMNTNFLAKRLVRARLGAFRLHCEELTGQTDNGPDRQRKFRGILLPEFRPL